MTQAAKLPLKLAGTNGNGFALLGAAVRAARKAGWTAEQVDDLKKRATRGSYDDLLLAIATAFDVE